jgi:carboxyl-terminal processing protease
MGQTKIILKEEKIMQNLRRLFKNILAILIIIIASTPKIHSDDNNVYKQLNLFGEVYERVRSEYVEKISDKELIEAAINGMLQSLDPHSSYLNAESFTEMKIQTKGEFGGLGIEVTMENGLVKVVSPIDETPAAKAGIQSGDYISHINDEPVMGLSLSEAVDKMRGPINTELKITVLREGKESFNLTLKRAVIQVTSIKSKKEKDVGYLRITSFTQKTYKNLVKEFKKLNEDMKGNMKGLVLDLRNNPGGLLDQAVSVSDAFLDRGEIVSTRGRDNKGEQRYNASKGDITNGLPIVILINGGSASASEIVAGALQDHKRGILMGTKTFGKGSVQTIIPVTSKGAVRLTTARYYTPSGVSIQAKGVSPDIYVPQSKIEVLEKNNTRREADLRKALDKEKSNLQDENVVNNSIEKEKKDQDYQLDRAIDLIRSISLYENIKQAS